MYAGSLPRLTAYPFLLARSSLSLLFSFARSILNRRFSSLQMVVIIFSTLIYFAERGTWDNSLMTFVDADGDPSNFGSIPAAAWFTIVTITTVSYSLVMCLPSKSSAV
jgi:hypothetical protein